jgi:hypothetical protein
MRVGNGRSGAGTISLFAESDLLRGLAHRAMSQIDPSFGRTKASMGGQESLIRVEIRKISQNSGKRRRVR